MQVEFVQKDDHLGVRWVAQVKQGASWRYFKEGFQGHKFPPEKKKEVKL
jgi:hypothetical protein